MPITTFPGTGGDPTGAPRPSRTTRPRAHPKAPAPPLGTKTVRNLGPFAHVSRSRDVQLINAANDSSGLRRARCADSAPPVTPPPGLKTAPVVTSITPPPSSQPVQSLMSSPPIALSSSFEAHCVAVRRASRIGLDVDSPSSASEDSDTNNHITSPRTTSVGTSVTEAALNRIPSCDTSSGTCQEGNTAHSLVRLPRRTSRTITQCLTEFVFPPLTRPLRVTKLQGPDAVAAIRQLEDGTLQVQHHAELALLLLCQLHRVSGLPDQSPANPKGKYCDAEPTDVRGHRKSVNAWLRSESHMTQFASECFPSDIVAARTWRYHLGDAINRLIQAPHTFQRDRKPERVIRWRLPRFRDAEHRCFDWLALREPTSKVKRSEPVAMMSWRMDADASAFHELYDATMSTVPQDWNLHLKYPGIELRKRSGGGLSAAARVLALVTWQGMHHYRVRWAIVFNGNTAMVAYLAKQHTMFLSKPFGREGDKGLTLASALFALAVMKHGSDSARPMGTMRDNSLSFLPRPSGALIYSQWEMVCDNCEWAVKDTQLFRDAAEFPDSSESESGSEVNV